MNWVADFTIFSFAFLVIAPGFVSCWQLDTTGESAGKRERKPGAGRENRHARNSLGLVRWSRAQPNQRFGLGSLALLLIHLYHHSVAA